MERRHDERHSIGILWRRTVARGALFFPFWQGEALFLTDEEMDKALTGELPLLYADTGWCVQSPKSAPPAAGCPGTYRARAGCESCSAPPAKRISNHPPPQALSSAAADVPANP